MDTELHTTPEVFDALAGEWDDLLHPERSDNLFLTLDWQRTWWEHLGRGELSVVTVRDPSGTLIGIGSWFIEAHSGRRVVRSVGCTEVTDYLDIIARPDHEDATQNALLDFMLSDKAPAWDVIDLCNIPQESLTLEHLPRLAEARGLAVQSEVQEVCPIIDLPDTFEEYLEQLDGKQRREIRRKLRHAEGDVDWRIVGEEHNLQEEIKAYLDLMAMSTVEKKQFLEWRGNRAFFQAMGQTMFERGVLELIFLMVNGQRAASMWNFVYRDRLLVYNSGLNPADFSAFSPGIVLTAYSVRHAIEQGLKKYDFLRGGEIYKYRMGAKDTTVHNLIIER